MAFFSSFLQYFIIMFILAGVAAMGIFTGKQLRDRADAKDE
ncbi:MAG: vanadium nitrogenase [Roseburia sp.]|nr:vanadium nitrogenase [Roseburia sp.]